MTNQSNNYCQRERGGGLKRIHVAQIGLVPQAWGGREEGAKLTLVLARSWPNRGGQGVGGDIGFAQKIERGGRRRKVQNCEKVKLQELS